MERVTIRDIAKATGVSAGAVSFALNDRPGVSEATRERVKEAAARLGWSPNPAALALSGQRARAIGLVIARSGETLSAERFFLSLIAGIEDALSPRGWSLVLQLAPGVEDEMNVHRTWWAGRRVDGVLLTDPRPDDPRATVLAEVNLPGVWVGTPLGLTGTLPGVQVDDAGAMRRVVEHLRAQGCRRIAHVGGAPGLLHTEARVRALHEAALAYGLTVVPSTPTDFSESAGRRETEGLLALSERPDAIAYDNEILALGGLAAIQEAGLRVPDDIALVSFEDSPVCRVVTPPLTALRRDPAVLGKHATELLLALVDEEPARDVVEPTPDLVVRGSTAAIVRG